MSKKQLPLVRFVVLYGGSDEKWEQGIFRAAHALQRTESFAGRDRDELAKLLSWFNANLREAHGYIDHDPICWFKPQVRECIQRAQRMAAILQRHGLWTTTRTTWSPGIIVYEDEFEVAAMQAGSIKKLRYGTGKFIAYHFFNFLDFLLRLLDPLFILLGKRP